MPPKKPAPPAPRFDPSQVAALLDKQQATRLAAAGPALNPTASLGAPTGKATQLSLSELDALRQRLAQLWSIPAGARDPQELVVVFRIKLKRDGTLDGWPTVGCPAARRRSRSPPARAPLVPSTAASPTTCSGPRPTSYGKTSRSPSIRAT